MALPLNLWVAHTPFPNTSLLAFGHKYTLTANILVLRFDATKQNSPKVYLKLPTNNSLMYFGVEEAVQEWVEERTRGILGA